MQEGGGRPQSPLILRFAVYMRPVHLIGLKTGRFNASRLRKVVENVDISRTFSQETVGRTQLSLRTAESLDTHSETEAAKWNSAINIILFIYFVLSHCDTEKKNLLEV